MKTEFLLSILYFPHWELRYDMFLKLLSLVFCFLCFWYWRCAAASLSVIFDNNCLILLGLAILLFQYRRYLCFSFKGSLCNGLYLDADFHSSLVCDVQQIFIVLLFCCISPKLDGHKNWSPFGDSSDSKISPSVTMSCTEVERSARAELCTIFFPEEKLFCAFLVCGLWHEMGF